MSLIDMSLRGLRAMTRIRTLIASFEANYDEASQKLTAMAVSYLSAEASPPDYPVLLGTHIAILKAVLDKVFKAEKEFREGFSTKNALGKSVRKEQGPELGQLLRQLRTSARQHYGDEILADFGLTSAPEGSYRQLLASARHFLELTDKLDFTTYTPLEGAEALDFAMRVTRIRNLHDATDAKQTEYELAVKEVEIRKSALAETIQEARKVSVNVAKNQESFYLLAGMDEQARRRRYLATRPRPTKAVEPEDTQDGDETPESRPETEAPPESAPSPEAASPG